MHLPAHVRATAQPRNRATARPRDRFDRADRRKRLGSLDAALDACDVRGGSVLSFHHHHSVLDACGLPWQDRLPTLTVPSDRRVAPGAPSMIVAKSR